MQADNKDNDRIAQAIVELNPKAAADAARDAVRAGIDVLTIIEDGISKGMVRVGEKFRADEYHLPELLYAEEVMRTSLDAVNRAAEGSELQGVTKEAEERLLELSRSWVGQLSSCVIRLFRYDDERKKQSK